MEVGVHFNHPVQSVMLIRSIPRDSYTSPRELRLSSSNVLTVLIESTTLIGLPQFSQVTAMITSGLRVVMIRSMVAPARTTQSG